MSKRTNQPDPYIVLHVPTEQSGQTLSSVLKALLGQSSWGKIQDWIRQRHVQVNGNLCCDPARRVKEQDVIKLWHEALAKPVTADQLKLPYLDEHLLVVEKPAGITSVWHRAERDLPARRRQLQPTLEELLAGALEIILGPPPGARRHHSVGSQKFGNRSRIGKSQPERWPVYPVHRLDRDTSGLMLFARTRLAEQKLVALFRDHRIERQYWAVAQGQVVSQTMRSWLVRDRGDGLRGSLPDESSVAQPRSTARSDSSAATSNASPDASPSETVIPRGSGKGLDDDDAHAQLAVTHVELVEHFGAYSIIRCRLETGRTHQIRIHLSEAGHPLCGDKTYVRLPGGRIVEDGSAAPRQALHAERLVFTHPLTGERLDYRMVLPADLRNWLKRLRNSPQ